MTTASWQLQTPIDAVIFDCDGTLSTIEGIDELAKKNGVYDSVCALTAEAMGKTGINIELYDERLRLVHPTEAQVLQIGNEYYTHKVPNIKQIIRLFKQLGKSVYLVSAGLYPAVSRFGQLLKIPQQNIFAVAIQFDLQGHYLDFDRNSSLCHRQGKRDIVEHIKTQHERIVFVGDGLNDLAAKDLVTRFIGYGGSYYRQNIAEQCEFYIKTLSMAPLVPLSLTKNEYATLEAEDEKLYTEGLCAISECFHTLPPVACPRDP